MLAHFCGYQVHPASYWRYLSNCFETLFKKYTSYILSKLIALPHCSPYCVTDWSSELIPHSHTHAIAMMTSSNGNIFHVTGPLCGEFTGPGEFPTQRPVTRSFDVFFDLRRNKRLSKQPWGWWFETPSCSLWRHRNGTGASGTTLNHMGKVGL